MIKIISIITLCFFLCSCFNEKQQQKYPRYKTIRTYTSPSAYYGKPISRIYMSPYAISRDYYFDNDQHYVPPREYGITRDNYVPDRRAPAPAPTRRYRLR